MRPFSAPATASACRVMDERTDDARHRHVPQQASPASKAVPQRSPFSPLARRLALLITLVALVALALLAIATLVFANRDVTTLSGRQRADLGGAVASAVKVSYQQANNWKTANLSPALTLASKAGMAIQVRDQSGSLVASATPSGVRANDLGSALEVPVIVDGDTVGTVSVRTSTAGIGAANTSLRHALAAGIGWSALVLAILATFAGVAFARRISRPVVALTGAARAMASGERGVRVPNNEARGELGDLSRTFNHMADTLDLEDQLRRDLVADVAHELRTPLAILQATTEAMADGVTEPTGATLSSLHDETLRLGRIVEDLEVLSSAKAAGLHLELKLVDLAVVADDAITGLQSQIQGAGLSLTRDLVSAVVLGDKNRLHQVLTNLLTNAIKFTPAGGSVRVSVSTQDRVARVIIEDSGKGIAQEDLGHVFDRFWRGRDVRNTAGSGVGLAVVAELVRAHKGQVSVTSQVGHGSQFVVTIPVA